MSKHLTSIHPTLEKRIATYATACAAAGVSCIVAQPAEAKIVYTATNTSIGASTPIDLNHDGITDFTFGLHVLDKSLMLTVAPNATGNEIRVKGDGAAAGFFGVPVGPGEQFSANDIYSWGVFMAFFFGGYGTSTGGSNGPWANTKNRYLGFKFVINGQTHYGWARLSVGETGSLLTGFAYETEPNTTIIEGHLSDGTADNVVPQLLAPRSNLACLGALARGVDGLPIWRREEEM